MFDEGESTRPARLANNPQIGNLPPKSQNLIEPLSERELEILRLVNAGLSDQRDRRQAYCHRRHSEKTPQQHLWQARRQQSHPGDCAGA